MNLYATSFELDLECDRLSYSHVLNALATWQLEEPCLCIYLTVAPIQPARAVRIKLTGKILNEVMPLEMVLERLQAMCVPSSMLVRSSVGS